MQPMIRRSFLKKLLITTIGILAMSNKLFAKEVLSKSVVKDGVFYNNFIGHTGSFKDLWKWTIENPEEFWTYFWDYSKIKGDKGKKVIQYNKVFNKTKFFPDSKINYAENILKKKTDDIAIHFLSEKGFEESISWNKLYEKV